MKKLFSILFLLALCFSAKAATVVFDFADLAGGADYFRLASSTNKLRITPLDNPKYVNGKLLGKDWKEYLPDTNGTVTATNIQPGDYLCAIKIRYLETSFQITVTNTTNTILAGAISTALTNSVSPSGRAYSMTASDARFILNPSSKTNGQFLKWNGSDWVAADSTPGGGSGDVTTSQLNSASNVLQTQITANLTSAVNQSNVLRSLVNTTSNGIIAQITTTSNGLISYVVGQSNAVMAYLATQSNAISLRLIATNAALLSYVANASNNLYGIIASRPPGITNDSTGSGGYVKTISTPTLVYNDAQYSVQDWYSSDGFLLASIGYNPADGQSKYGQFSMFGSATSPYGNVGGFHVWNTNLNAGATNADRRMFVLRVKDPAGGTNDGGGYTLFENRYSPDGLDGEAGAFANFLLCDPFGNVALGDLTGAADFTPGIRPWGKTTFYASSSGSYPLIGLQPRDLMPSPVTNSLEWTGLDLYQTDTNGLRQRYLKESDSVGSGSMLPVNGNQLSTNGGTLSIKSGARATNFQSSATLQMWASGANRYFYSYDANSLLLKTAGVGGDSSSVVWDFTDSTNKFVLHVPLKLDAGVSGDGSGLTNLPQSGETNTASSLGGGKNIFAGKSGADLRFNSVTGGVGVAVSSNNNLLSFDAAIDAGTNVTFTTNGGRITINASGSGATNIILASTTLNFPSTPADTENELSVTVTGAALNDPVVLGIPTASMDVGLTYQAWVGGSDSVQVRVHNHTGSTIDPVSGTFKIAVIKTNAVTAIVTASDSNFTSLSNDVRNLKNLQQNHAPGSGLTTVTNFGTNVTWSVSYPTNAFGASSNTLTLGSPNLFYYHAATTNTSITNFSGTSATEYKSATLFINNTTGGNITNYISLGYAFGPSSTNILTIPAGKIAVISAGAFGQLFTNYVTILQQ